MHCLFLFSKTLSQASDVRQIISSKGCDRTQTPPFWQADPGPGIGVGCNGRWMSKMHGLPELGRSTLHYHTILPMCAGLGYAGCRG